MSRTTIMRLWPETERIEYGDEYRNSWGSANIVWDSMFNRYMEKRHEYDSWLTRAGSNDSEFWALYKRQDIPVNHRLLFLLTLDGAYVAAKNYERLADDIETFFKDFPVKGEHVNHWPTIVSLLRSKPDCPAIGFYWTSCGDNFWKHSYFHNEDDGDPNYDRPKPFDWSHTYDVYDEMEAMERERVPVAT